MFWDNFIRLCQKSNTSPNGVAKKLAISSGSITSWKQGRVPHYNTLLKIADYFGVSVDYLLADESKKSPDSPLISELSERDRDAARLYRALISAGYVREGETLTTEQVGTLKAVITLLDSSFGNSEK